MRSLASIAMLVVVSAAFAQEETPKAADPRLVVELFAKAPDIVHPVACDFDAKGRLLVVESHTHFAPKDYKGPKADRVLAFNPALALGAGNPTTFFEGTRHTMDIAAHPDGAIYIATRNEILRLRETKDGVKSERIVFLDTKGDYPHNGLSGLCFDSKGDLTFGMGENLGAKYTLIGSDGVKFTGQGDGGHIFHCTADGKRLHRVATGFWNPFGICRDIYGRTFAVDNDPDQSPPCRMLHVVEGGDYGFRFCYGRSGKHPFQSWHGELPGTLPMMTGVGEAPCEILSYESDGLPKEYLGQLLVTSWADHRVERYKVLPRGASFKAERVPFVQGGTNFRPTGMCAAPDGSLYVCDWVKSDYTLHGNGAIWHIRAKNDTNRERKRPDDPREAIFSMHRPLREWAARTLASKTKGRRFLYEKLDRANPREGSRVRASALTALIDAGGDFEKMVKYAHDSDFGILDMAARFLDIRRDDNSHKATTFLMFGTDLALRDRPDPFGLNDTIQKLAINPKRLKLIDPSKLANPRQRILLLLALRAAFDANAPAMVGKFLNHPDEDVRFLAVKWIADEKLADYRKDVEKAMADPKLSVRMYTAYATALARIDGKDVNEKTLADYFAKRLADDQTPAAQRAMFLKQVPATHKALTIPLLTKLLKSDDATLKMEAVRALVEHPNPQRTNPLFEVFRNPKLDTRLRAFASLDLGSNAAEELGILAKDEASPLRMDALRALNGKRDIEINRPPAKDTDAWLKRLEGKADPDAGSRVFFHPKLAGCYKCHRIDGRGADVGPDLSGIGRTERRHLLESILQPSNTVAPHYVAWHLETAAGKVMSGMLLHTQLDEYTYLDAKGGRFKLKTGDLADQRPLTTSIMPDGLIDRLTDQEIRDLLAYLQTRK